MSYWVEITSREDFASLMSTNGEYGGDTELAVISSI
jgi:hypothetical protein